MRAFFCIELDEGVKAGLDAVIQTLKRDKLWRAARVSWVKRENLHVTVKFLGEVDPARVEELRLAAELASAGFRPFPLELDLLGAFPNPQRPRVIWAGCSSPPSQALKLYEQLERELAPLGFPPEGKAYTPHVTLGRVKDGVRTGGSLGKIEPFRFLAEARGLTLMESRLDPAGAIYTPIFRLEAGSS
ncbi:MAG: RNA 2',3'-cyclic phosphodiesterase [Candidatus Acetothermia bacterium]|jgi:2'-5' RNA ligase|nr:RNA 2',3'-cyclic phosphodiesterase [Candidatus Acetothermia bacterium]MDH7505714.1 RNA 2',3'-cyclic phosphodiesterase [Candidatus Acetothermia bacterium]